MKLRTRVINVLVSLDQFVFSLVTLGSSAPDESMSAAAFRLESKGRLPGRIFRPLIDALFWFDPLHCRVAYEAEIFGRQRASRTL
jgi:hypothetical protein